MSIMSLSIHLLLSNLSCFFLLSFCQHLPCPSPNGRARLPGICACDDVSLRAG